MNAVSPPDMDEVEEWGVIREEGQEGGMVVGKGIMEDDKDTCFGFFCGNACPIVNSTC